MGARFILIIAVLPAWELTSTRFGDVQGSLLELETSRAHFAVRGRRGFCEQNIFTQRTAKNHAPEVSHPDATKHRGAAVSRQRSQ